MDKLKEMMLKMKPKQKLTLQKDVVIKQQQDFQKKQEEFHKAKQLEETKKLEVIAEYFDKPRKKVKLQAEPQPPISVHEVKEGLRKIYQPATLFGESPMHRYNRLLKAQKFNQDHPNEDMRLYDQDFIRKIKQNEEYEELDAKYRDMLIEPKILNDLATRKKKEQQIKLGEKKLFSQMCDEVHLWLIKMIRSWTETLEQKLQNHSELKDKYRTKFSLLEETTFELTSLISVLKQRKGDKDMIESIYYIMNSCLIREYVEANTRYIELSIGNAPWPMGVAMLGITVKRNSDKLSYVLDNQITRKWILGIKRLVTLSQQLYPNEDKMKMVGYTVHTMT